MIDGVFTIVMLIIVIHFSGIAWLAYGTWAQKWLTCLCGHKFKISDGREDNCPSCGEKYLA
ncbi:MAG: hypothetical protein JSV75_02120 [Candidatus Bathyarchaeota archaeon]|nr:MAG: hypothetical protein JSV75_02120 [Candidatus Bathyarchaeota archaeon]